jgi:shikimate kinase
VTITHEDPVPETLTRCIVLVGFMAAGKSTVGRSLAHTLGWRFIDLDDEIVRRSGSSIADIFRTRGEQEFRALEMSLTQELTSLAHIVLAPGGGWITSPTALERLPHGASVVWLRISAEEAVQRARDSITERPLLAGDDPLSAARQLLAVREPMYQRAHFTIDVDQKTTEEVVNEIIGHIK